MCWKRHSERFAIVQDSSGGDLDKGGQCSLEDTRAGDRWEVEDEMKREAKDGYGKTRRGVLGMFVKVSKFWARNLNQREAGDTGGSRIN